MEKALNIFYTIDRNFIKYFSVSVISLIESNKSLNLNIFLVYDFEDNGELLKVINEIQNKYQRSITALHQDSSLFDNYSILNHVTKSTYLRLLIADIIPPDIEDGLFIDSDTVITGSLEGLIKINFASSDIKDTIRQSKYLYAVREIKVESDANSQRLSKMGYVSDRYFNAGVMYISLTNWRKFGITDKLINIAQTHMNELIYEDQDVLNICFLNQWAELDPTYNALHLIRELPVRPLIVHFVGPSKPWHYMNNHPYKHIYIKYLKKTLYKKDKVFNDISLSKIIKKHIYETRDYINFYRSGEYKRI